ncbi:HDIG domain-containing protein [Synechococcus sp. Tobar12-5m-g]|uniref:HDIG domain-containing metalloprotein n=1 Tax=unclassified Synechococcus TaxID=2626047 RepID=UPI0020CD6514|nr:MULTISPECIES: HDIG domain-containing metalloprotein [unclassified Synechococcus]MCP9772915.1 HDIG domain-containing protein [Synechococcus sp. Tobar12-5m-g]MCP9873772.1 HDIG domain-containing protein [Synechococcus sp. Cruz CV-v-12]
MLPLARAQQLWRQWLRRESPRQALYAWRQRDWLAVLLSCTLVALLSSWPWLVEPILRPGIPAPFSARAPRAATVVDSDALEQRRSQLGTRTNVQVVDPQANLELRQRLERQIQELEQVAASPQERVAPLNLKPAEQAWLSAQGPAQRAAWNQNIRLAQQRMLSQGVVGSVAKHQLELAARLQLGELPEPAQSLGSRLLALNLQGHTNLRNDAGLSQRLIEELLNQQGIPRIQVKQGDLITRQGEPISPQAYDVLDYFGMVDRRPLLRAWLAHFLEALAACLVVVLIIRRWRTNLEPRHALLVLGMLLVVQAFKLWLGNTASPLALLVPATLLLAQGLGTIAGLAWLAAASLLWPEPLDDYSEVRLMVATAVAVVAAVLAGRQRSRAQLVQLAILLPSGALVLQWITVQVVALWHGRTRLPPTGTELGAEALLMGGLLMAGLLLGPLVESFFGLLTRARLLELADLQRPLLRRLSLEAPGTFEHTLMICGLAEEGARAIHGDVDLIRTGSLYHDVGKLHAPEWFIENQSEGPNPHDLLDDPGGSASVLQAHVDEGLKLARRHRLPRPLADFIPEHQGTLRMGYFFHQARERNPRVPEENFRYRGPRPQRRETAILMLADGCEAALRSLPPGTSEEEASQMVRRLIDARRLDGQLKDSGLSRGELELVIRAFVRVWKRMRHRRIPYPIPARKAYSA